MNELPLVTRARRHGPAIAVRSASLDHSYDELLDRSATLASALLHETDDLEESRVAFLVPSSMDYIVVQWAIWRAGGVVVPLSLSATEAELEYALTDSQSCCVVTTETLIHKVTPLCRRLKLPLIVFDDIGEPEPKSLPKFSSKRRGMMLYTSGTTSKPKGVVTTHANIQAQIEALVDAWRWQSDDCIALFLPLHHIHGIVNVVACALWSGATVETLPRFEIELILSRVAARAFTVFMAVPTIYVKLIQALRSQTPDDRAETIAGFAAMRLMVSGSAALPASVHEQWTELTGQQLLERYGMTEIGMALSNPYDGERLPGTVGQPLPGVDLRLKSEQGDIVNADGEPGEIQVRGPAVFCEYWNRPEITEKSFDQGWFRTGDVAVCENGYYRIMGRLSVDIIKSGGYKLSALEIEATLLEHSAINECAVVGVADDTWGECVAAAVVIDESEELTLEALRSWCRDRLSNYKIPQRLLVVDRLPRNAMGKVTKPAVGALFS